MKILFIITKSEIGGAQKYVKEQIEICHPISQVYLLTNEQGWLVDEVEAMIEKSLLDKRIESRFSPGLIGRIRQFVKDNGIDLIVANSANGGLYGRLAAAWCRIPSVYVSHGWSSVYNGGKLAFVLNRVERMLAGLGTKVFCVSSADYQIARTKIGIPESKLSLIRNCVLPVKATPADYNEGDRLQLLCLARFAPPKRMDLIIEAVKDLDFIDLHLFGNGPEFPLYKAQLETHNRTHIFLHGEVRNFSDFHQYHAFILISDSEGLPMSALEAMSAGLPLVLSNVGGCPELVVNNDLLVENTVADIQAALHKLKVNYTKYQVNMQPFFDAHFNLEINKEKYIALYSSIIRNNRNS